MSRLCVDVCVCVCVCVMEVGGSGTGLDLWRTTFVQINTSTRHLYTILGENGQETFYQSFLNHSACRSWPSVPFSDQPRSEATYPTTFCAKPLGDWMALAIGFQVNSQLKEEQSTKESRGWRTTGAYLPLLSQIKVDSFQQGWEKKGLHLVNWVLALSPDPLNNATLVGSECPQLTHWSCHSNSHITNRPQI